MDTRLLELLVCPHCKGPLNYDRERQELNCPADRLAFALRDGIAVMLNSEARDTTPPTQPAPLSELSGSDRA